ncbi:MAG: hypothetical protein KDB23_07895 [Planctomycetales bacterium]|nr:hypothetical protein [Planctomycetales bacterium]
MTMKSSFVAALFLCALVANHGAGQIVGFVETFSGNGEYSSDPRWESYAGLDNPGWLIGVPEGAVGADGLHVITVSDPAPEAGVSVSRIVRTKEGTGSFIERVLVNNSVITTNVQSSVQLSLSHFMRGFPNEDSSLTLALGEGEPTQPADWAVYAHTIQESERTIFFSELVPVNTSPDVLLELRYNARSKEMTFAYDLDTEDDIPAVTRGPFQYDGIVTDAQSSQLYFSAGGAASIEGIVNERSLTPISSFDLSMNGQLDVDDVLMLQAAVSSGEYRLLYDLNEDDVVDDTDVNYWVHDVKHTYFGDADLDGEFNNADLISVFQAGEYEDNLPGNSTWSTGDWNADGEFTTSDLVIALQDGGYEQGPRAAVAYVPEPSGLLIPATSLLGIAITRGRRRS